MFRRAAALLIATSTIFVVGAAMARADAPSNANNCAGVFVSGVTPAFTVTALPSFGESRRELARAGLTGEAEKAATEALASCGTPYLAPYKSLVALAAGRCDREASIPLEH